MRSFGEWFNSQTPANNTPEEELPNGIIERDGKYYAECCRCGREQEIPVGIDEIPMDGYRHYCGGSPRCCP